MFGKRLVKFPKPNLTELAKTAEPWTEPNLHFGRFLYIQISDKIQI